MSEGVSLWAEAWFGEAAGDIGRRVARAITAAHVAAAAAQEVSETKKRHPYGGAIRNTAHERLADELVGLPGAETRTVPGSPHKLVTWPGRRVTLYPLRYAQDGRTRRDAARIRLSTLRLGLLGKSESSDPAQLTFDHVELTSEEIEEEFAAQAEFEEELGSLSTVVIVGFASGPEGLHHLGWGQGSLGTDGFINWEHWENLPLPGSAIDVGGSNDLAGRPTAVGPVGSGADLPPTTPRLPRFDDDDTEDDNLDISARRGGTGTPSQEETPDLPQAGAEDDQP